MSPTFNLVERIDCSSAHQFLDAISPIGPNFSRYARNETWIFRGVGSADYTLTPRAFREEGRELLFRIAASDVKEFADKKWNAVQWLVEAIAVRHFFIRADEVGLPFPEDSQITRGALFACVFKVGDLARQLQKRRPEAIAVADPDYWVPQSLLSFVAIAQHHGIPTRFLDWTFSPFVAAYFAARDALQRTGEAIAVHALFSPGIMPRGCHQSVFAREDLILAPITVPRAANPNLNAQEGVFTYLERRVPQPDDDWRPFAIDTTLEGASNPAPEFAPVLFKFTLSREKAPELLWCLDRLGYHSARLFPGFDGSARAVTELLDLRCPSEQPEPR